MSVYQRWFNHQLVVDWHEACNLNSPSSTVGSPKSFQNGYTKKWKDLGPPTDLNREEFSLLKPGAWRPYLNYICGRHLLDWSSISWLNPKSAYLILLSIAPYWVSSWHRLVTDGLSIRWLVTINLFVLNKPVLSPVLELFQLWINCMLKKCSFLRRVNCLEKTT